MPVRRKKDNETIFRKITAKDIMSEVVVCVDQNTFIRDVAHLMFRDRINGLPVIGSKKKIVGILTMTDLFQMIHQVSEGVTRDFYNKVLQCRHVKVKDAMSKEVFSISPATSIDLMLYLMWKKDIHSFPVMKSGKLVGMVGRHDIANAVLAM